MNFLTTLLGGGASGIINSITNVVDELTLSKEEKQEFKLKMQDKMMEMDRLAQEGFNKEIEARADIIKAEMAQGDKYTKRARPTIVYAGLLMIFIDYVVIPLIAHFNGSIDSLYHGDTYFLALPSEFWWAWTTVVGVYGVGRTAEKFGYVNKITNAMSGSSAANVNQAVSNSKKSVG